MFTIVNGDIVGWDGNSTEAGKKRHYVLEDFEAQSNIPWRREHTLSAIVGEIFKCDNSEEIFKAVYPFQRNRKGSEDECEIVLRDHHFNTRVIPKIRTRHTSLSMYLLDLEREHELELFQKLHESYENSEEKDERRNTYISTLMDMEDQGDEIDADEEEENNVKLKDGDNKIEQLMLAEKIQPLNALIEKDADARNMIETSKQKYGKKYARTPFDINSISTPKLYAIRQDRRRKFDPVEIPSRLEDLEVKKGEKISFSETFRNRRKKGKNKVDKFELFSKQIFS